MDIREITNKMDQFVSEMGWYKKDSHKPQTIKNLAISLAIEASEVLEHVQWKEQVDNKEEFAKELADVALYLLQIAKISNIDLEEAILTKLKENYSREW